MRFPAITKLALIAAPATLFSACTQGPDYVRPEVPVPATIRAPVALQEATSIADLPWWEVFSDPVLQEMVSRALQANPDIAIAAARVEQARALAGVAKSEAATQIGYEGAAGMEKTFIPSPNAPTDVKYSAWSAGISAAWEFDLWGRIKRSTESAHAQLYAEEAVRRGVLLSLASEVTAAYFELLSLDRQLRVAEDSGRVFGENVDFFNLRFKAGRDSQLPVERSQANLAQSQERIAELKRQIAVQENAISVLTGGYPNGIPRGRALEDQGLPETPVGATTVLLQRRPDIRQAEQLMISANAEVGVAAANYFPRIGLGAFFGGQHLNFEHSVEETFTVWNVVGTIAGPISTGGRLRSEKESRKAYWDETVASYRKAILTAFKETSDALYAQKSAAERRVALETRVAALQRSVDLARTRFDAGRANYYEVLEAEQQLFPAQSTLAEARREQLIAVVALYKALGGGWKLAPEQWSIGATTVPPPATAAPRPVSNR